MNNQLKIQNLIDVGLAACDVIAREVKSGITPYTKRDGSTVTNADHASERVILQELRRLFPTTPIVSEEAHAAEESDSWQDHAWLVDPLDSTSGFARGSPDYAVILGEVLDGAPVWGMVAVPHTRTIYVGDVLGAQAVKYENGVIMPISCRQVPESDAILVHSPYESPHYLNHMSMCKTWARGSALKFGLIAEGIADHYVRRSSLNLWDVAGGHALLRAAGGDVTTHACATIRYDYRNPYVSPFWARGR